MNKNEAVVAEAIQRQGFQVINKGWPDFLCIKKSWDRSLRGYSNDPTGVMCVEVKAGKDTLSSEQTVVHSVLKSAGLPVYVIRPDELKSAFKTRKFLTSQQMADALRKLQQLQRDVAQLESMILESSSLLEPTSACPYSAAEIVRGYLDRGELLSSHIDDRLPHGVEDLV